MMNGFESRLDAALSALNEEFAVAEVSTEYQDARNRLLAAERKGFWYTAAQLRASPTELKAGEIIFKLREWERKHLFGNLPGEAVPHPDSRDLGDRFLVNKSRIDKSDTFKIAKQMPKGAHLHIHFNSELPPEVLLPRARDLPTMFIRTTNRLYDPEEFETAEIAFKVMDEDTKRANIFSEDYDPKLENTGSSPWMRWADFRQQFPADKAKLENPHDNFKELQGMAEYWAREKMIITLKNAYGDRQTTNGAWACFNQGTRAFKGLLNYEGIYRWYIGEAIESMIRDKVMYAELRPMLLDKTIPSDDASRELGLSEQMQIICEETRKKQAELKARGELDKFPFGLRIIYCTPRSIKRDRMKVELADCIKLKIQYPDLICGFDLVGAEDRPNNINHYSDLLKAFATTCEKQGISIPFMFHAGETLRDTGGSHNPDNSNLYDSLLLRAKRIGHGYSLGKHNTLTKEYIDKGICLELCPISNELLHLCGNVKQHQLYSLLDDGFQCCLNADNPSLYR